MKKFWILARVQLRALLASLQGNVSRKKARSSQAILILIFVLCLCASSWYSFSLAGQLTQIGGLDLLFLFTPGLAVILCLLLTIFAAQGVVFGGKDADLMLSMPVPACSVLLAKLTALYTENLLFCLFLVLPAGAAWLWYGGGGGVWFLLRLVIGVLFLALLPTVLALAGGFILSWFANRKLVSLLLYGLLLAGVMVLGIQINLSLSALAAETIGLAVEGIFTGWGLPFQLFQRGVCGSGSALGVFCLLTLVPVLLAAGLFSKGYQRVLTGLHSQGKRSTYLLSTMRTAGQRKALLKKEASRYFGSPIYLFNTAIGPILLAVAGVACIVMGSSVWSLLAGLGTGLPPVLLAALFTAILLSTAAITGSSISLEGQTLWILKESPVPACVLLNVKAGFHMLLVCPCLLVGIAGITWGLGLTLAEGGALLLFGASFGVFTAWMGLIVNLHFPKLDAVNDMVVVKMSAASIVTVCGGMGTAVVCGLLVWFSLGFLKEELCLALCSLVLLLGCALQIRWLHTRGAERFLEL